MAHSFVRGFETAKYIKGILHDSQQMGIAGSDRNPARARRRLSQKRVRIPSCLTMSDKVTRLFVCSFLPLNTAVVAGAQRCEQSRGRVSNGVFRLDNLAVLPNSDTLVVWRRHGNSDRDGDFQNPQHWLTGMEEYRGFSPVTVNGDCKAHAQATERIPHGYCVDNQSGRKIKIGDYGWFS